MFCTSLRITTGLTLTQVIMTEAHIELQEEPYCIEPYLFDPEYTEDELRTERQIRRGPASSTGVSTNIKNGRYLLVYLQSLRTHGI